MHAESTGPTPARLAPDPGALIDRHLILARALARQYRGKRLAAEDLEGEAYLALCEAARAYDLLEHPESFRAYAERVIRSALRKAIETAPIVRGPRAAERAALKGDAAPPEPYPVAVELLGTAPRQPADSAPLVAAVAAALDACSEVGRALACYVHLDGLSLSQAARRLGIGVYRARNELALADLAIAGELRRAGWDERSWAEAI